MKNQELVNMIDSELEFKGGFPGFLGRPVYKVKKDGNFYVIKIFDYLHGWQKEHIQQETAILKKAKNIEGITHLVHDYGLIDQYLAILKEYAPGVTLQNYGEPINPMLKSQIKKTVKKLHKLRISNMDLHSQNIVIGPNEESAKIIDLGYGNIFPRWKRINNFITFKQGKKNDLKLIKKF